MNCTELKKYRQIQYIFAVQTQAQFIHLVKILYCYFTTIILILRLLDNAFTGIC